MSDYGELCRDMREHKRRIRAKFGVDCPQCKVARPKANPSLLLPQQRCKVDGYRDPRPALTQKDHDSVEN
jgi:hypothetical protein